MPAAGFFMKWNDLKISPEPTNELSRIWERCTVWPTVPQTKRATENGAPFAFPSVAAMPSRGANMAIMRIERTQRGREGLGKRLLLVGLLLLTVALATAANCAAQTVDPVETIRVDSDLVDLQVSVLSHNPSSLREALQQGDFLALEDGVPQEITF